MRNWQSKEKRWWPNCSMFTCFNVDCSLKKKKNNQKKQKKRATKGVGSFEPVLHAWCNRLIMKISSSPASRSKVTTFSPLFVVRSIFSSSVRLSVPNRQLQFIQFNYYSSSFLFCFGDYKIVTSPCVLVVKSCWTFNKIFTLIIWS